MKTKRSFLLLEVLAAVSIIGLCAYPLIAPHIKMAQLETESLENRILERYADETFIHIVQSLHDNVLPQRSLREPIGWQSFENKSPNIALEPIEINLGKDRVYRFERSYTISKVEEEDPSDSYMLLAIQLEFTREGKSRAFEDYAYQVILEKEKTSSTN